MVRNAIRIISLTIFKLNDQKINILLQDLPFCTYFVQLALYLRDKVLDIDQSYCTPTNNKNYDLLFHATEDLQDILEYFHEIFEVDNIVVNELLCNALLYQCYLPIVVSSLVCVNQKPMISIGTSLFVLIHTFKDLQYAPLINSIVCSLLLEKIPIPIKTAIETYPEK